MRLRKRPVRAQRAASSRDTGSGRNHLTGPPIGVLDSESKGRDRGHAQQDKKGRVPKKPKAILDDLIAEAEGGDPTTRPAPASNNETKKEVKESKSTPAEYDSKAPYLVVQDLLKKIEENQKIRAERDATTPYEREYNPHLLHHIFGRAPYTFSLCKRCTSHRKCLAHRNVFQQETSISLCPHTRLNLYWAVDDPENRRCSWVLEIREYFGRGDNKEHFYREQHEGCKNLSAEGRMEELAARVVGDMRAESRRGQRGLERMQERRVAREIHALLGAWHRAVALRMEREERIMKAEERKRVRRVQDQEKLAEALRIVKEDKDKQEAVTKDEVVKSVKEVPSVEEDKLAEEVQSIEEDKPTEEIQSIGEDKSIEEEKPAEEIQSVGEDEPELTKVAKGVEYVEQVTLVTDETVETVTSAPQQPTPLEATSPSPSAETSNPATPDLASGDCSSPTTDSYRTPSVTPPPSSPPHTKRKRSVSVSVSDRKKTKKVRWVSEIEHSTDVVRPRIMSPPYKQALDSSHADEGRFSPIWNHGDAEDEVDYGDGEDD